MEMANLDSIVQSIESMKSYYNWSSADWDPINQELNFLIKRNNDTSLYLGIVGEFSSGKSTFINALLGMEFLKEDVLQGTTCAPTILQYGKNFDIEIYQNDNNIPLKYYDTLSFWNKFSNKLKKCLKIKQKISKSLEKAKPFLYKYSADEEFSKTISKVVIYLPEKLPIFENNIAIVDTPGINATNSRHQDITEQTIKQLCDLPLVLTPASAPCSQTLLSFLGHHLPKFHKYCICIISQFDRIRKREHERQFNYVVSRFKNEGFDFLKTYKCAPYFSAHPEENDNKDADEYRKEFIDIVKSLCSEVKTNRNKIISIKLHQILENIVDNLISPLIEKASLEINTRYETLKNNQLIDFDTFLENNQQKALNILETNFERVSWQDIIDAAIKSFHDQLLEEIDSANEKGELQKVTQQKNVEKTMAEISKEIILPAKDQLSEIFMTMVEDYNQNFHTEFNNEFRNLADSTVMTIDAAFENKDFNFIDQNTISQSNSFSKDLAKQRHKHMGKMAAAGIIGSLICPGLGTVVGLGVVKLIDHIFGKKLEEYKNEARAVLENICNTWQSELDKKLKEMLTFAFEDIKNYQKESIAAYSSYADTIKSIVKQEKEKLDTYKKFLQQAQKDQNYLGNLLSRNMENEREA